MNQAYQNRMSNQTVQNCLFTRTLKTLSNKNHFRYNLINDIENEKGLLSMFHIKLSSNSSYCCLVLNSNGQFMKIW